MVGDGLKDSDARRVVALKRSGARRKRLDDALRAQLATQRGELAQCEASRDQCAQQIEREAGLLGVYQQRIEAMMTGDKAFSLEGLNSCRMYIGLVNERLRKLEAELAQAQQQVDASLAASTQTRREIALNLSRIDLCGEQISEIHRKHYNAVSDVNDEDAEEAALARRFNERSAPR